MPLQLTDGTTLENQKSVISWIQRYMPYYRLLHSEQARLAELVRDPAAFMASSGSLILGEPTLVLNNGFGGVRKLITLISARPATVKLAADLQQLRAAPKIPNNFTELYVQTFRMSGDRATIAAAMLLNYRRRGVIILVNESPAAIRRGRDLFNFYAGSLGIHYGGIRLTIVKNSDEEYQRFKALSKGSKAQYAIRGLGWVGASVSDPGKAVFFWASQATADVSLAFSPQIVAVNEPNWEDKFPGQAREAARKAAKDKFHEKRKLAEQERQAKVAGAYAMIRRSWSDPFEETVTEFLKEEGFRPGQAYALLWVKHGAPTDAKAHHYTSVATWRKLAGQIRSHTPYIPVAVGEDIGFHTFPSLVSFWTRRGWTTRFGPNRVAQLGVYGVLAKYHRVKSIGMISGALEAPAMLGIPTLYIEEANSERLGRFESWAIPGFRQHKVILPPGLKQNVYWAEYYRKQDFGNGPPSGFLRMHRRRMRNFTLGTSVDALILRDRSSDKPTPRKAFNAVIRQINQLGYGESEQGIMAELAWPQEEFNRILEWLLK